MTDAAEKIKLTFNKEVSLDNIKRVLSLIETVALCDADLAEAMPCSLRTARRYLAHLHNAERSIRIDSFKRHAVSGHRRAHYIAGSGKDAKRPAAVRHYCYTTPAAVHRLKHLLDLLEADALCESDIAKAIPCSEATARRYLAHLYAAKRIHIDYFVRNDIKGSLRPYYLAGRGKDAEKPERMTAERRNEKYNLKRKGYVVRVILNSQRRLPLPKTVSNE